MEFTGELQGVQIDYNTGTYMITFTVNETERLKGIEELKGKLSVKAQKYRKKRSLDANAYAWVLMGKIAEKTNLTNIEVYKHMIQDSGVYEVTPIRDDAVERYLEVWRGLGLGWIAETFPSKLEGYTNVRSFYGSSSYDTREMSRLIDNIVRECQELNIETLPENELKSLLEQWEIKRKKENRNVG